MGRRPVEFSTEVDPANHAEDLGIHEMGRSLVRVRSESFAHWFSIGAG